MNLRTGIVCIVMDFPTFEPRLPWWGPDLQTLRNKVRPRSVALPPGKRLMIPMADGTGDQLSASLHGESGDELVVLVHGLGGCEDSDYVRATASHLLSLGRRVLRLNLRGAGASGATCRLQYHAGRSADLLGVFKQLIDEGIAASFLPIGYSLGGNMLLKCLAEYGRELPLLGAVSVSAPLDLEAACHRILAPRNRLYHGYLLGQIRAESLRESAVLTPSERNAVVQAKTIYEFDQNFVAPRNGFTDAEDYYSRNMSLRFLPDVGVRTLVIHSLDDPWIPGDSYERFDWSSNPNLVPLLSPAGGHVGFHGRQSRVPWHDRCIERFLQSLPTQ